MSEEIRRLKRRRVATDALATALGVAALAAFVLRGERAALYLGAYGVLVGTSTSVVTFCLSRFTGITIDEPPGNEAADLDGSQPRSEAADHDGSQSGSDSADHDGSQSATGVERGHDGSRPGSGPWGVFTGRALESDADIQEDTGWLIGRMENVIVLTLVLAGAFTALSIIFAAKSWVRREDITRENTTYYLAGTLVNFTYSIAVGIATLRLPEMV